MTAPAPPDAELILYTTDDGRARLVCRFEGETLWLTQAQMAALFDKDVRTINEHLGNIFEEGEVEPEATIRRSRMVRTEGNRSVSREIEHYALPAVLAVGYRVRSQRGTQFRQWATARLGEYLEKGFAHRVRPADLTLRRPLVQPRSASRAPPRFLICQLAAEREIPKSSHSTSRSDSPRPRKAAAGRSSSAAKAFARWLSRYREDAPCAAPKGRSERAPRSRPSAAASAKRLGATPSSRSK